MRIPISGIGPRLSGVCGMWTYAWDGIGLEIVSPQGRSVYLQGDEGAALHETLVDASDDRAEQVLLDAYSEVVR
jgi:hypothetical protein